MIVEIRNSTPMYIYFIKQYGVTEMDHVVVGEDAYAYVHIFR